MIARTNTGVRRFLFPLGGVLIVGVAAAQNSVVDSPHNLSASGPGSVRAVSEEQVCVFCHTPHNATPIRPLWNRAMPVQSYSIYTSRALDAQPGQPTGASKMCLSCHDGTIALGTIASSPTSISMSGGVTTIPLGPGHLGTDLRDDHPISFRFDSALAIDDPKLRDPGALPPEIRLDPNAELQCTSCHDAHNNGFGDFLVMRSDDSQLCVSCHRVGTTTISAHESCDTCHQPHSAPSGPYLLRHATVADTCLSCHDGTHAGAANIQASLSMISRHETFSPVDPPEPLERHTSCTSCHDPHTMTTLVTEAPDAQGALGEVSGVSASGGPIDDVNYEYEACFKCHADTTTIQPWVSRVIAQNNTRLEFDSGAISFHPVEVQGRNANVPSLVPGLTVSDMIRCSDCHGSEAMSPFDPKGVHGSNFRPLLVANYTTADYTSESAQAYALCYMCHERNSILSDESFSEHRLHIVDERAPCAACHDAHGISSVQGSPTGNTHLINFATNIVFPDPGTGRLEYRDTGMLSGECFLRCHNETHGPERYPDD